MIVIAIGDPHFKLDNFTEVDIFIERIEKLCIERKPDIIVILGDVLDTHERLHTLPLNKAFDFINRMRKIALTYILVGNHDLISNQEFLTSNHWMNALKEWKNVVIVDKVCIYEKDSCKFVFVPYVDKGRFKEALQNTDLSDVNCIFAHQEFLGCKFGAVSSIHGDIWPEDYPYVISGHIHENQTLKNIYYPGSSTQQGETEKNIIPILTFKNNKKYDLEEVDLKLPKKKIIRVDASNLDNLNVEDDENKKQIVVSGDQEEFKAFKKTKKYKELVKKGIQVRYKEKKKEKGNKDKNDIKIEQSDETDFKNILYNLVIREKNPDLFQVYEYIINNNIIDNDVIFLTRLD